MHVIFLSECLIPTIGTGRPRPPAEQLAGKAPPAVQTTYDSGAQEGDCGALLQPAPGRQERSGKEAFFFFFFLV